MLEQVYYDKGGIQVTAITVRDHDHVYPTSSIIDIDIQIERPNRWRSLLFIFGGVLLLILGVGIILIIIGIWWLFSQRTAYRLIIKTKTRSNMLCRSTDIQAIKSLQTALLIATAYAQATVNLLNTAREQNGLLSVRDADIATRLDLSTLLSLLDSLVSSGYASQHEDLKGGVTLYNFKKILSGMDELIVIARAKRNMLSVDGAVSATGLWALDVQTILNCLVLSGAATISQDLRNNVTLYKFNSTNN